ncbi:YbgC/FadM family acyl-CoA thioesterase [Longimicrobium terrae]|uniref:Thioesterase-3 n=1 Tax=Longimicrobium terrae TaxID=1639882 RepID=A0A841GW76_9BACT|nr:thioesterase-3 [Longimicrobium terrae]MBB6069823.1 thioesterase-3 [Longimicrobium terrae]NNC30969.1 acyl-CoA thioesterase [Longimicrobium terrae]NNC32745.1 acyl-CoA thioesterase [Longimicrobium terrae]
MITTMDIEVRSTELDALGHVNNAKYMEYLEWGRFEWVKANGIPLDFFGKSRLSTVLVNVNINFRHEANLGDRLSVRTWLAEMGRSSFRIGQEIVNQRGERITDATVTSVMFDTTTRSSVYIPDEIRHRLEPLVRG